MFPDCEPTTFDQFTSVMKVPKRKPGASPARLGQISSPKNQKKNQAAKLKSLTETKMDIIMEDTGFYSLMGNVNFFPQLEHN